MVQDLSNRAARLSLFGLTMLASGLGASSATAAVTLTPRVAYYFDNNSQRSSSVNLAQAGADANPQLDGANQQIRDLFGQNASISVGNFSAGSFANQIDFPLYGGSISLDLGSNGTTQITLTGLYGKGSSRFSSTQTGVQRISVLGLVAEDIQTNTGDGKGHFRRLDLEATVQHRLSERFAIIAGARYERVRTRLDITSQFATSNNGQNLINVLLGGDTIDLSVGTGTGSGSAKAVASTYSARAGGAAFVPLSSSGQLYVTGVLQTSYQPKGSYSIKTTVSTGGTTVDARSRSRYKAELSVGPDISVGYSQRLTDAIGLDIRYRAAFYFPVTGPSDFADPRVNHGITFGVSLLI